MIEVKRSPDDFLPTDIFFIQDLETGGYIGVQRCELRDLGKILLMKAGIKVVKTEAVPVKE